MMNRLSVKQLYKNYSFKKIKELTNKLLLNDCLILETNQIV